MALVKPHSLLSDFDVALFLNGKHLKLYEKLGAIEMELDGEKGCFFAVWAPNAEQVSVLGNFNFWNKESHPLFRRWDDSGIWEGFIPGVLTGEAYKYGILTKSGDFLEKIDPFGLFFETPPKTASIVWNTYSEWNDQEWMAIRKEKNSHKSPMSIYELHLGSWQKTLDNDYLSYDDLAEKLVSYVQEMGFTHVEFMPVMEHPYAPSWGYQITGFFAPSSRFGDPQGFMRLIQALHVADIGVILDWVPSHFPGDAHALHQFDGTALYEHPDPKRGFHPDWQSYIFDYGRNEVRSFLLSNAAFWCDRYHVDGLRVDAVASMLYLDYSRKAGEWEPNTYGGNHNLEAISFLQDLNVHLYGEFPDIQIIAEESTSFPGVSKPVFQGGLGFGQKWMMGWMNDTLRFFEKDPIHRKYHLNDLTFSLIYAFTENFCLPLSHDEVVYGKKSLLSKMPGDDWQKFANLRLLLAHQFTHPGTKLLFMGGEFGQWEEWNHNQSLDWHLCEQTPHQGIQALIKQLNHLYRTENALHAKQFQYEGFEWIESQDHQNVVICFQRKGDQKQPIIVVLNFTPIPRDNYRIGVPMPGIWKVLLNSDETVYGGSGYPCSGATMTEEINWQGKAFSISINLPPLSALILKA